ncbi:helix-turn-helix domain-containing protein [Kitasatospora kifunensis]|nr:helix-turn-helix transcriptional regulator [Kitasatospora kifunensis]
MALAQTVRRRQLGAELRRLREAKGLSAEEVSHNLPRWGVSKISRMENAKVAVREKEVAELLEFYEADAELTKILLEVTRNAAKRGWWQSYREVLTPRLSDLIALEAEASEIKLYETFFVPGLFQTADYARTVITQLGNPAVGIDAQVEIRVARQSILTRPSPPEIWAVINEAALRARVGSPGVMAGQLERLVGLTHLSNVNIQVMPIDAAVHPGMDGAFTGINFPHQSGLDVVLVPTARSSLWIEDHSDVGRYKAIFQKVTAEALSLEKSLEFIIDLKDRLTK